MDSERARAIMRPVLGVLDEEGLGEEVEVVIAAVGIERTKECATERINVRSETSRNITTNSASNREGARAFDASESKLLATYTVRIRISRTGRLETKKGASVAFESVSISRSRRDGATRLDQQCFGGFIARAWSCGRDAGRSGINWCCSPVCESRRVD